MSVARSTGPAALGADLSDKQVVAMIREACEVSGGQKPWADRHGFSTGYLNDVLQGRRHPSRKVLDAIGVVRIVTYRRRGGVAK